MMWSSLPGLSRALSKQSGLFVAAMTITSLLHTSWQSNCQTAKTCWLNTDQMLCSAIKRLEAHFHNFSDLLLCAALLHSLCLEDLLRPSPLQCLQANSIHLIQEHRQEACLCAVSCLTVRPRADQRVNLIKEQDTRSAGPGLAKQLRAERLRLMGETNRKDTSTADIHRYYYRLWEESTCAKAFSESPT